MVADPRVNMNLVPGTPAPPSWSQGPPGPAGPPGPMGPPGPEGPVGPEAPGIQGPPGPGWVSSTRDPVAGDTGWPVGTLWLNEFSNNYFKLDSLSPLATWTNQGDLGGPPGPQGPAGPTGATGATGPTGPAGATGATGPQGQTGATGSQGPPGQGVPVGGTTGQVLTKINATDYNTNWQTPSGGALSWPLLAPNGAATAPSYSFANQTNSGMYLLVPGVLSLALAGTSILNMSGTNFQVNAPFSVNGFASTFGGHVIFGTDNTYDIGASGATRPRDLFVARNSRIAGVVGIGAATPTASIGLNIQHVYTLTSNTQLGIQNFPFFSSAATASGTALWTGVGTQNSTFTMGNGYALDVGSPSIQAGSSVTNLYGAMIRNQGASGVTNAYGLYITAQSGAASTNIGLYNAGLTRLDNHLQWQTDATYDIGNNGPNRPRDLWMSGTIHANTMSLGGNLDINGQGVVNVGALIQNGSPVAQNGFVRMRNNQTVNWRNAANTGDVSIILDTNDQFGFQGSKGLYVGSANERLRNPVNAAANLSIESADGTVYVAGMNASELLCNLYWDGSNWMRFNVANRAGAIITGPVNPMVVHNVPSGANPATLPPPVLTVDPNGCLTLSYAGSVPSAPTIQIGNGAFINGKDFAGTTRPFLAYTTDNYTSHYLGQPGLIFVDYANTARVGGVQAGGHIWCNGTISGGTGAAVNGGYAFSANNLTSGLGQGIAYAWATYACVDHALEFGLDVESVTDPVGKLKALQPFYYQHSQIGPFDNQPARDKQGQIISTPQYGMRASQVAEVLPELAPDHMSIDYSRLVVVLWAACQQMEQRISALEGAST